MGRKTRIAAAILMVAVAALFVAWVTSPDPRGNTASFEETPLEVRLAPISDAATLASFRSDDGSLATMAVTRIEGERVFGIDLASLGAARTGDALRDFASVDRASITSESLVRQNEISRRIGTLLPSAPGGIRHIGTGTNFPEHAEEASSDSVFQFPKFGLATPARTILQAQAGVLLDYEVELCMRFDRDITSVEVFDAAIKGLFLCGDFTNRNALIELADPENLDSGYGFSDAKSGPDYFPSGPFIVVPNDWESFVDRIRMTTSVNGEPRQDARGAEMTMDFRQLAGRALADMEKPRFFYRGDFYKLAEGDRIDRDMALMSGTSEGVIFTPPSRADYIEGAIAYIANGGPFSDTGLVDTIKERFIRNELESRHFLHAGDVVRHDSNFLGGIEVKVVDP